MIEVNETTTTTPARTAGSILREAREQQGVHIAALAATIKVSQQKLEALEADRHGELPDATFTRALAQAVCRALKTDPAPVLALLPQHAGHRLEHVAEGLKEPFDERAGRSEPADWIGGLSSPAAWGVLGIVALTAAVWLLPQQWVSGLQAAPGASAPAAAASGAVTTSGVTTTGVAVPADAASAVLAAPAAGDGVDAPASAPVFGATPFGAVVPAAAAPAAEPSAAAGSGVPAASPAAVVPVRSLESK